MSSMWSSAGVQGVTSPFATTGMAPTPGGSTVNRVQSAGKAVVPASNARVPGQKLNSGVTSASTSAATPGTASTSAGAATITSNDFLSLLVTEMQNQDPTSQTDPNAYVNQLVQINSLEQLIAMNGNLTAVLGAATNTPTKSATPTAAITSEPAETEKYSIAGLKPKLGNDTQAQSSAIGVASGNLSTPGATAASQKVAHALDGHPRMGRHGPFIRDIRTH